MTEPNFRFVLVFKGAKANKFVSNFRMGIVDDCKKIQFQTDWSAAGHDFPETRVYGRHLLSHEKLFNQSQKLIVDGALTFVFDVNSSKTFSF